MKALQGHLPRAYPDGRSKVARSYREACSPYIERFGGTVPSDARELLKTFGRLSVDIDRLHEELERALSRRRATAARRLRRQIAIHAAQLLRLSERLDALVERHAPSEWNALRGFRSR